MLKLVGGTDVIEQKPVKNNELQAIARKIILEHVVAGKSVKQWIQEPDLPTDELLGSSKALAKSMIALDKLGIGVLKNGEEHGLSNDTYGTVFDSALLCRRIPDLKKLDIDVTALALYY